MGIKRFKPTSPGIRQMTVHTFEEITKTEPERSLVERLVKTGGRNVYGRITSRFRGGGHKRLYRVIDFKRNMDGVPATVKAIEYDPNRTSRIALVAYANGRKAYILAPVGVKIGDVISSGPNADIKPGNALALINIPVGTLVHNIELTPGKGGQMARSAGAFAQVMGREGKYTLLRLPSGEMRLVLSACRATVGQVGNLENENISIGKAGRSRWLGRRPHNRGSVMNPVDHPHGGGEGRAPIGRKSPLTPWGKPTLGYKTRKKGKASDKYIKQRRTK